MSSHPLTSFANAGENGGGKINLDLEIGVFACASEEVSRTKGEKCDQSSVMDSEPGRCRRTDGRKWRCTRNVTPLQKYCQRHMHRGSRKHVEPIQTTDNRASDDSRMPVVSLVASDIDTRASTSCRSGFPSILNLKCMNDETRGVMLADSSISVDYGRSVCSCLRANSLKSSFDGNPMSLSSRKHNFVGNNYVGFDSSRYGLSPKSVLNAAGKVGLGSGHISTMEPELQRCRRTDGKKWQCRREALDSQKYCEAHMHQGAKRVVVKPEYSRHLQSTPTISRNLDSGINLNIVPECSQPRMSNDSCSSTSDATTITD